MEDGNEALIEEDTPAHGPAVVLRSQYAFVRALLGIAVTAVAALTAAVVILANANSEASGGRSAKPIHPIDYKAVKRALWSRSDALNRMYRLGEYRSEATLAPGHAQ
jgi:hypothetical protein